MGRGPGTHLSTRGRDASAPDSPSRRRYKPPPSECNPALDDPTPDYMNLLGMIFSMCGLMLKVGRAASLCGAARPRAASE